MQETTEPAYNVNGHHFEVVKRYESQGSELVQCSECMDRQALDDEDDPDDYLEMVTEQCHIEWLRQPDGGFRGVALRNAGGFPGRQLIAVDSDGEITDKVRVYDDDAALLESMLDNSEWARREEVGVQ